MIPQYVNKVVSSTLLYYDNKILTKGQAYKNTNSYIYPTNVTHQGYYTYSLPYSQIVSDQSVPGCRIMSGIYLDNSFITPGQSGLVDINHQRGQVYFSSQVTGSNRLSGVYSVKDYNVELTNLSEHQILFETQYTHKSKTPISPTGLYSNQATYPVIYFRQDGGANEPFAFGGQDLTNTHMKAIILADSLYLLDAACSIIEDTARTLVPIFDQTNMPYNSYGGFRSGQIFNYTGVITGRIEGGDYCFIDEVNIKKYNQSVLADAKLLNPEVYLGIAEIKLTKARYPRSE